MDLLLLVFVLMIFTAFLGGRPERVLEGIIVGIFKIVEAILSALFRGAPPRRY